MTLRHVPPDDLLLEIFRSFDQKSTTDSYRIISITITCCSIPSRIFTSLSFFGYTTFPLPKDTTSPLIPFNRLLSVTCSAVRDAGAQECRSWLIERLRVTICGKSECSRFVSIALQR